MQGVKLPTRRMCRSYELNAVKCFYLGNTSSVVISPTKNRSPTKCLTEVAGEKTTERWANISHLRTTYPGSPMSRNRRSSNMILRYNIHLAMCFLDHLIYFVRTRCSRHGLTPPNVPTSAEVKSPPYLLRRRFTSFLPTIGRTKCSFSDSVRR